MERRTYCVYNETRETFISLNVRSADTVFSRLKGFGRLKLKADEGIWVVPARKVHTVGFFFPLDLIYLDDNHRVIRHVEYFPSFQIRPLKTNAESVLVLPPHTIYSSQTQMGDKLVICVAEDLKRRLQFAETVHHE